MQTYLSRKGYGVKKAGNEDLIEELKETLTVKPRVNPGTPGADLVKPFPVYKENSTKLYIPVAFGYERFGEPRHNIFKDPQECGEHRPNLIFNGTLRAEQEEPVQSYLSSKRGGIISLKCAAGKTVMALYIATQLKKKTLVICHKNFLLDQWKERIAQFVPTASVGLIKAKVIDCQNRDIVMASLQSLAMKDYDASLFTQFGLVIVDEAHHLGAEVFSQALPKVIAPWMLGLSATLNRKDGLRKVFEWYLGTPVYETKKRTDTDLIAKVVRYYDKNEEYSKERVMWNGKKNMPQMLNAICNYEPRNVVLLDILADVLKKEPGRQTIILSDRRNHLTSLAKQIEARGLGSYGFYVGGMKPQDLKESETKDIILGTYTLVSEGFDVPSLNTLVFASPISSIEQSVGRIQRQKQCDRKFTPVVIDIWDDFSIFRNQGFRRLKFYKKNGYTIENLTQDGKVMVAESDEDGDDGQDSETDTKPKTKNRSNADTSYEFLEDEE